MLGFFARGLIEYIHRLRLILSTNTHRKSGRFRVLPLVGQGLRKRQRGSCAQVQSGKHKRAKQLAAENEVADVWS